MSHPVPSSTPQAPARAWPRWLRRNTLELVACAVIGLGLLMLLQPFALVLYTWSFVTTLTGVVLFTIAARLPE